MADGDPQLPVYILVVTPAEGADPPTWERFGTTVFDAAPTPDEGQEVVECPLGFPDSWRYDPDSKGFAIKIVHGQTGNQLNAPNTPGVVAALIQHLVNIGTITSAAGDDIMNGTVPE